MALATRHAFGFNGGAAASLHFIGDSIIAFPVGQNIVLHNTENGSQKFLHASGGEGITCLALSPNKKFLAIGEKSDRARASIHDVQTLKRRKELDKSDVGAKMYVSMSFSSDGKILAAQGGAPQYNLVLFQWEKQRVFSVVQTVSSSVETPPQVMFHPQDPNLLSVAGPRTLRTYKVSDTSLKPQASPVGKRDPQSFTCHTWIVEERDRILAATEGGEIMVVEGNEVKAILPGHNEGLQIRCILPYSKGFICGLDQGAVMIYERASEEREPFKRAQSLAIGSDVSPIMSLSVSQSEETLALALRNNQIYSISLTSPEALQSDSSGFRFLADSHHSQAITGLDACIRKPLVASCGSDRTVRVWNHQEKCSEIAKSWQEEAFSVAFHPSGFYILVGFADKLRLINVLMESLITYKEFGIKACKECCFSNGGQYFAAVNSNTIQIYNTYTCENIGNLRGHNGKVRSLHWHYDDSRIISAGMDGAVYLWRLNSLKRESENVLKGCDYKCVITSPDGKTTYAVGSDKKLKEFHDGQIQEEHTSDVVITQIAMPSSTRLLLAGTQNGSIRVYKIPLTGEYWEYNVHNSAVTRLCISFDDTIAFSADEEGALLIFDLYDKDGKPLSKKDKEALPSSEEVMVLKSDMEEKRARMQELEQQVNELQSQNEYQLRLKDMNHNEKMKEMAERYNSELESERQKFESLLQEKNEQEMEYEEKLRQAEERHQKQLNETEQQYHEKIMAEVERYQQLQKEKEMLAEKKEEEKSLLTEGHERTIAQTTEEYEDAIQEERGKIERLQEEKEEIQRESDELKRQLEEDADREIEELKERYEKQLNQEREASLRLKGENGIMKKKFNDLKKEIEDQKEEISKQHEQKKELQQTITNLERDIGSLKKEINERDETISDKEKRIYDLKKKNQELEKFKFVLDYKIKELKKQVDPKDKEISEMRDQIKNMDSELQWYHKNNSSLDLTISDLKLRLDGLQKENQRQRQVDVDKANVIERMQHDLHEAVQHIQEPEKLKASVKKLNEKHLGQQSQRITVGEDVHREYARQREYLEQNVEALRDKLNNDAEMHKNERAKYVEQNSQLLKEINELKRENKMLRERTPSLPAPGGKGWSGRTLSRRSEDGAQEDMQGAEVLQLRRELEQKDQRIIELEAMLEGVNTGRPASRERLPSMEGFKAEAGEGNQASEQ